MRATYYYGVCIRRRNTRRFASKQATKNLPKDASYAYLCRKNFHYRAVSIQNRVPELQKPHLTTSTHQNETGFAIEATILLPSLHTSAMETLFRTFLRSSRWTARQPCLRCRGNVSSFTTRRQLTSSARHLAEHTEQQHPATKSAAPDIERMRAVYEMRNRTTM